MAKSITSFQQGISGNPKGRPRKGYSISETFREMFNSNPDIKKKLVQKILDKALGGDTTACKLIWGYMDGLPNQQTEIISHAPPSPIMGGSSLID